MQAVMVLPLARAPSIITAPEAARARSTALSITRGRYARPTTATVSIRHSYRPQPVRRIFAGY